MLIILTDRIVGADLNDDNILAIENVLSSAHYGNHFVLAERECSRWLYENIDIFTAPTKGVILYIKNNITQFRSIVQQVEHRIDVGSNSTTEIFNRFPITLNLSRFCKRSLTDIVDFVCEDLIDCDVFKVAARTYRKKLSLRGGVRISLSNVGGGGVNTSRALKNSVENNERLTLCIVDSDKEYPTGPNGDTAQKCMAYIAGLSRPVFVHVLNSREAENIIPTELLIDASLHADTDKLRRIDGLDDLLSCLDFKKGMCRKDIDNAKGKVKGYLSDVFDMAVALGVLVDNNDASCSYKQCKKAVTNECVYKIVPTLSNGLLNDVVDFSYDKSDGVLHAYSQGRTEIEWLEVGRYVFEWGLAFQRSSV